MRQRHLLGLPGSLGRVRGAASEAAARQPQGRESWGQAMLAGFKEGGSRSQGGGCCLGEPRPEFSGPWSRS